MSALLQTTSSGLLDCQAPRIAHSAELSCSEGPLIASGRNCTVQCASGSVASETSLYCYNGTLSLATLECHSLGTTDSPETRSANVRSHDAPSSAARKFPPADNETNESDQGFGLDLGNFTNMTEWLDLEAYPYWVPPTCISVVSCICLICLVRLCFPRSRRRVAANGSGPDYVSVDMNANGEAQPYAACVCCGFLVCKVDRSE